MRPELAKRDDVWRFRRRPGLAVGKNRHAMVGQTHERHCSLSPTPQSQREIGATNCRAVMGVTVRAYVSKLPSAGDTVCLLADIGMQNVCPSIPIAIVGHRRPLCHQLGRQVELDSISGRRSGTRTTCTLQGAFAVTSEATERHHASARCDAPGAPSTMRST